MNLPSHLLTLDFETYWDDDYTLKKLSTEEYVRSPLFRSHGAAVKYGSTLSRWVTHNNLPDFLSGVPWADVALLCQHAQFDGLILSHHYGIVPALYLDTLAMARMALPRQRHNLRVLSHHFGLPPKGDAVNLFKGVRVLTQELEEVVAEYCCGDADNTFGVFQALKPSIPRDEWEVIDLTTRLFTQPQLRLNVPRARSLLAKTIRSKRSARQRLGVAKEDLSSTDKFAALLESRFGIDVEMKAGKPKADGTERLLPAVAKTDPFMKSLLEHENPDVQAVAAARLEEKSTLEETRLRRLVGMAERGPLCVYLNFAGAHTFRWSGGDGCNWQNFPRGSELRRCILAPEGHVLVVADLAQIEARMLNTLAEQWDILELFEKGDPYSVLASKFFGRHVDRKANPADKGAGQVGKVGELQLGYGSGPPKLRATLRVGAMGGPPVIIDLDTAKAWVKAYRSSHPKVVDYWSQGETALQLLHAGVENYPWGPMVLDKGYVVLPNGTKLDYTGLAREDGEWRMYRRDGKLMRNQFGAPIRLYGAMMVENAVQALSRVILSDAFVRLRRQKFFDRFPLAMTSHDEAVAIALREAAEECQALMIEALTKRPSWLPRIPLAAEGGFDECYSK